MQQKQNYILKLSKVEKAFPLKGGGEYIAVTDVNLDIKTDEIVSIIGHSGCGKSTILNMIAGLDLNTKGAMLLDNKEITRPGPDKGVVFQNHSLLPWLTVHKNIEIAVKKVMPHLSSKELKERVEHFISLVGLELAAQKYPSEISGGMKQRVGIARALSIKPKVLLMDEPFGALDSLTRANLQDHLMRIQSQVQNAVIVITHDIDEAVLLSDRVVIMSNGPSATIETIVDIDLERPRDRVTLQNNPKYIQYRSTILDYLYNKLAHEQA